jgi:hypothetical protein
MNNVPQKLKNKWATEKPICCRKDEGNCAGKLTKDHTITFKGRQLQEDWAIVDVCEYHHAVNTYMDCGDLNREKHVWVALNRATNSELTAISKAIDYLQLRDRLNKTYGKY